jgi:hypothetical protein
MATGKKAEAVDERIKLARKRRIYVQMRLPAVKQELEQTIGERKKLVAEAPRAPEMIAADRKAFWDRRIFIDFRVAAIRDELKSLMAERKNIAEELKAHREKSA